MSDRNVASYTQYRTDAGIIPSSAPTLLYPIDAGDHWEWDATGPADGSIIQVSGVTQVDPGGTGGMTAVEINNRILVF